jgi:hypothetical protein
MDAIIFIYATAYTGVWVQDGDRFWKLPECYVRGNSIKYFRIPDEVAAQAEADQQQQARGFGDSEWTRLCLAHEI